MVVCPKCGYENLDNVLYCNLCKEVFRKEKKEPPPKDKITSIYDLPPDLKNLLQQQKIEIMNKEKRESFLLTTNIVKKGYILFAIIGIGILALFLLRFLLTTFVK